MKRVLIPILPLLVVAACERAGEPMAPDPGPDRAAYLAAAGDASQDPTPDQMAVALAVPGFGGYFIDETGAPTVYLTDVAQRPAAETALAGFLASFGWSAADLRVRQAEYDYLQLDAWHRRSWTQALALTGSVFSTIDEGSNRLRFGGLDAAAVSSILNTVVALGVPAAAVDVVLTGPVLQAASLRDQIRPAHGGLQIQFFASPASPVLYNCTLGFNALHDGVQSFVTNSHCSNVQGSTALSTDYYQSTRGGLIPNPNHFIGSEVDDPAYTAGGECPVGRWCRYSDAARARYAPGQTFVLGSIARAAEFNAGTTSGDDDPSLIQIDDASPTWRITATQGTPILGQRLSKTGRTTGWTGGEVTGTCVHVNITASEITQLCQSVVGAFVAGGDSGSPVFGEHTDGSVFLAGILWGSSTNLTTGQVQFLFSPLAAVEGELGALTTVAPDEHPGKGKGRQKKAR
jgi:hypothetical protein